MRIYDAAAEHPMVNFSPPHQNLWAKSGSLRVPRLR